MRPELINYENEVFVIVFLGATGVSEGTTHFLPNHATIMTFLKENNSFLRRHYVRRYRYIYLKTLVFSWVYTLKKQKKNIFYWYCLKKKENVPRYNQGMADWSHRQQASG